MTAINGYVPSGANGSATRHASATVTANVTDGKLTIDAIGGTNTKLDYVDISSSTPDTTPPTVSVSRAGTQQSPGVYANRVTVTVNASDTGGSGLSSVSYSLNNGAFQPYSAPFDINTPAAVHLGKLECFFPRVSNAASIDFRRWTTIVGDHLVLEVRP